MIGIIPRGFVPQYSCVDCISLKILSLLVVCLSLWLKLYNLEVLEKNSRLIGGGGLFVKLALYRVISQHMTFLPHSISYIIILEEGKK